MYKVLMVSEEGRGGGPLGRIRMMAQELQNDMDITVVVPSSSEKYINRLKKEEIKFCTPNLNPLTTAPWGFIKYVFFFIPEIINLARLFSKLKPDVVHANGSWQFKGIIAAKLTGVRSIWHMNDTYQPRIVTRFFNLLAGFPDAYIYASKRTQEYYESISPKLKKCEQTKVIAAPVDRSYLISQARTTRRSKAIRFLTVGYINKWKGIELTIAAANELRDYDITFDVVGPILETRKIFANKLYKLIEELDVQTVSFLGYRKVDKTLFEEYDYYLCSSIKEASPMAVWESLSAGLPLVSTEVGDVAEIIRHHGCGVLSVDYNGASLAEAIKKILEVSDTEYHDMSKGALEASMFFDKEEVAKSYLSFYTQVISETSH